MKIKITILILLLSCLCLFAQSDNIEKKSPFTAVKWENSEPIVRFNSDWYTLEKIYRFTKSELLDFCKKQYKNKWQKRFSEDLIEVLINLNYKPSDNVTLVLSKNGVSKKCIGYLTNENRNSVVLYNKSNKKVPVNINKTITKAQALEDLDQFKQIINDRSSYIQISDFDYMKAIEKIKQTILAKEKNEIDIDELSHDMAKIMAEIGDRHSSVRNMSFNKKANKSLTLQLPFGLAVLNDKVIALKRDSSTKNYEYLHKDFPYLKSINGVIIEKLIDSFNYKAKKAPREARLSRGVAAIQQYGELLFMNNEKITDRVNVVFTDGVTEKFETLLLTNYKNGYSSKLDEQVFNSMILMRKKKFSELDTVLSGNIGYIKIPMMLHYNKVEGLEGYLNNTLQKLFNTKALIVDIRNNPGGGREILKTFASYIIQPEQSPWVANVTYLRLNDTVAFDLESMNGRFLYSYNSTLLDETDRLSISNFNKHFTTQSRFDETKFSEPFYMVLHSGDRIYKKPVFILVNQNCFSAATVFASAFKGLPNVKIVGITTDGSSGNSVKIHLKNSNIRVKVSTMLSFQRDGKVLDGNGTIPDIYIEVGKDQIFTGKDVQLNKLVEIIEKECNL